MRKLFKVQLGIGDIPIEDIVIDPQCRYEIPQLLSVLQELYKDVETREKDISNS